MIICVDFDGVMHYYTSGWKGAGIIPDPPVPGAFEWLTSLLDARFKVAIFSSRSNQEGGIYGMQNWFFDWGFDPHLLDFPTVKPPAHLSVDDRCFCFKGEFLSIETIKAFKPWYK